MARVAGEPLSSESWNPILITMDFGKVNIAGKEFWIPQTIHYEMIEKSSKRAETYSVDYADYRKLEASSEAKHGPEAQP